MGFFDMFKRENKKEQEDKPKGAILPFSVEYRTTSNGNLQVELTNVRTEDVTRLVVSRQPLNIENHPVYNCAVSWYSENDCQMFNPGTGKYESPRAEQYRGVLAEIDLDLLQKDSNYCIAVMSRLLDRERVEKYLEMGLQETPEVPCGKYVGGVVQKEEGYRKFFNEKVGRASHNSPRMVERRQKNREEQDAIDRRIIEAKRDQIERLKSEIAQIESSQREDR